MKVYGACHVCGKRASRSCKLCGRITCDEHLDPRTGICVVCRRGRMAGV